jgi:hypothetical protein
MTEIKDGKPMVSDTGALARDENYIHREVLNRRIFRINASMSIVGAVILGAIWVFTEYHNQGGWPSGFTFGFARPDVWNLWIVYPIAVWAALVALHGWLTYLRKSPTEREVELARRATSKKSPI